MGAVLQPGPRAGTRRVQVNRVLVPGGQQALRGVHEDRLRGLIGLAELPLARDFPAVDSRQDGHPGQVRGPAADPELSRGDLDEDRLGDLGKLLPGDAAAQQQTDHGLQQPPRGAERGALGTFVRICVH